MASGRLCVAVLLSLLLSAITRAGAIVEPYLTARTLAVVKIDLTRASLPAVSQTALESLRQANAPARSVDELRQRLDRISQGVGGQIERLRTAGVDQLYITIEFEGGEIGVMLVANKPTDGAAVDRVLQPLGLKSLDRVDAYVAVNQPLAKGPIRPTPRKDLLDQLSEAPVEIVVAMGAMEGFVPNFEGEWLPLFINGARRFSIRFDAPPQPVLSVRATAVNAKSADNLKRLINQHISDDVSKLLELTTQADTLTASLTRERFDALTALAIRNGFFGVPVLKEDYIAKLNEPILKTPRDQWAWPIYREAAIVLEEDYPDADWPSEPGWEETVEWLQRHEKAIQAIHAGAAKPALGVPLSFERTVDNALDPKQEAPRGGPLAQTVINVQLPYLHPMRTLAKTLSRDVALAVQNGDAKRIEEDTIALLNISDQLAKRDVLVTDLVAIGIRALSLKAIGHVLETKPDLLSDDLLKRLSERLGKQRVAGDLLSFRGERYAFYDVVQRIYSDDGKGEGRLVLGMPDIRGSLTFGVLELEEPAPEREALRLLVGLGSMLVAAPRSEVVREYDAIMDLHDARLQQNRRDLKGNPAEQRVRELKEQQWLRHMLIAVMVPSLDRAATAAERIIGQQEGLRVAIALEQYHRKHNAYPDKLDALVPGFLDSIPADRIDGKPLRYRLSDGKQIIYSVGADRDDDAGKMPMREGKPAPTLAAEWDERKPADGDWVLFPVR